MTYVEGTVTASRWEGECSKRIGGVVAVRTQVRKRKVGKRKQGGWGQPRSEECFTCVAKKGIGGKWSEQ